MKQTLFVIQELIAREMKRKYSRPSLGFYGGFSSLIVYGRSFPGIFYYVPESIENYPVYYLTGYLIWSVFYYSYQYKP